MAPCPHQHFLLNGFFTQAELIDTHAGTLLAVVECLARSLSRPPPFPLSLKVCYLL